MTKDESEADLRVSGAVVAHSALWSALTTILSVPLLAISTLVIARTLGPAGVGHIALDTFVTSFASGVVDLGITTALLRRGMLAAGLDDTAEVLKQAKAANTWSVLQAPVAVGVGALVLHRADALLIYAVGVLSARLFIGPSHLAVVTSRLAVASRVQLATTVLVVTSTIAIAIGTHRADLTFAIGILAANILTVVKIIGVPRSLRRESMKLGRMRLDRGDIAYALSSVLNDKVATLVFSQSEIAFFRTSQSIERGRYSVAQTIAARSTLVLDALLGPLAPAMTSAFGRGADALRRSFDVASTTICLLLLLACPAGFAVIALYAQPLFGNGFHGITMPALVLTLASLFQSASAPIIGLCWARRHVWPLLSSGLVGSAVDLGLAVVLVPRLGVDGAIVAGVAGQIVYFLALIGQIKGREERAISMRHAIETLVLLAAAAVPGLVLMRLSLPVASGLLVPAALIWTAGLSRAWVRLSRPAVSEAIGMLPGALQRMIGARPVALLIGTKTESTNPVQDRR